MSETVSAAIVEIQHGQVQCPCGCENVFRVKRSSYGAQKADLQTILDDDQRRIAAWARTLEAESWHTKEGLRESIKEVNVFIKPNPFNSAISCLVRLGFFSKKQKGHEVFYQFQESRFKEYLERDGFLK